MRLLGAIALFTLAVCAAPVAAQQQPPAPAPPGTTGPLQPPATQPPPPAEGQPPASQQPAAPQDPSQPTAPQVGRIIAADAGLIFFPVKPERTQDFEKIIAKVKEALTLSEDPVRRQQAEGLKVFKAVEPGPNGTALYVFLVDPAVKGSDYAFWKAIYDAFPAEVQELYRLYTAASASGQTLLNLQLVQDFNAQPATVKPRD